MELADGFYSQKRQRKTFKKIVKTITNIEKSKRELEFLLAKTKDAGEPVNILEEKKDQSLAEAMEEVITDELSIHKGLVLLPLR